MANLGQGGLLYGYQQGVLGQSFVMHSFQTKFPDVHDSASRQGWLTSVLQLGGWLGSLTCGIICEIYSRKLSLFGGAMFTVLGSFLGAGASSTAYLFAGRFFTGVGVGTLSATGPLYNAELAPPEVRGMLVSMQQLAITIGIMIAYWISYGSNNIGGTGVGQSDWAWRTPMLFQGIPAVVLAVGVWFLPYSPRWLVKQGRDEEAIAALSKLRGRSPDDRLVQIEYLEIKAEDEFEKKAFAKRFPNLSEKARKNQWTREIMSYIHVFRTKDSFKRVATASCIMFFQQWSGIDASKYRQPRVDNKSLTCHSHLLHAANLFEPRVDEQHELSPRYRDHWRDQCRYK
jgi:MFS family permease